MNQKKLREGEKCDPEGEIGDPEEYNNEKMLLNLPYQTKETLTSRILEM